jgi:hypothetical protein
MKKSIITLSAIAALSTAAFANDDVKLQLELLKNQIKQLEAKMEANEKAVQKVEKTVITNKKNITENKILANNDNIKWDVDFRTALDSITYKHASGKESKNSGLLTNRLHLGMGYAPDANNLFKGKLSYNKAYGDTANHGQSNSPMGVGYANFDWVTNENATDNTVKVKEAYWLYMNDTFLDTKVPWTISIGRRPSTDGLGINMREGMKDNSPLSHTVNVEFDGMSAKFNLDKVTGVEGMWWKLCTGRGLTNALPRFNMTTPGADYAKDESQSNNVDMYGFIFVPYDNGQYSVHMNWARADNLIGFNMMDMMSYQYATMGIDPRTLDMTSPATNYIGAGTTQLDGTSAMAATSGTTTALIPSASMAYAPQFRDFGSMDLLTVMAKAEGIGDGISDFLDDTRLFVSWAQSKTDPANGMNMLGSATGQTGHSEWVGLNMPCPLTKDGRIGIEWNKGSKYWRSVTYGEDTMAGSKIAARGTAWEVYYNKPLTKALTLNARYTNIEYDYTGSNSFFGEDGTPLTMAQARAMGQDPVEKASDFRIAISYRY